MEPQRYQIGIDLGTSTTVAVLRWPDGRRRPLLFDGSPLLPSAVHLDADGRLLTGRDALHGARVAPERFEPHPKRRIDDGAVLLGDRAVPVVDLLAAVLSRVAGEARRVADGEIGSVMLTHPAVWGAQRTAILAAAARAAGLPEPALVTEPVAAATYLLHVSPASVPSAGPLVVYDLGAGTFDATVVRRDGNACTVLATGGLSDAGGLDIDAAIVADLGAVYAQRDPGRWGRLASPVAPTDRRAAIALWDDVRTAKEALSRAPRTMVHLPLLDEQAPLGREQLDRLAGPVLERTVAATRHALAEAGVDAAGLAGILLVGGSTRLPLAATMLQRAFGIPPIVTEQPELVVAEGGVLVEAPVPPVRPHAPVPPAPHAPVPPAPPAPGPPASGPPAPPASGPPAPPASGPPAPPASGPPAPPAPGPPASGPHAPVTPGPLPVPAVPVPPPPIASVPQPPPARPGRRRVAVVAAVLAVLLVAAGGGLAWWLNRPDRGTGTGAGNASGRGDIVVDGAAVARSVRVDGTSQYRREYTSGAYAHVVGLKVDGVAATGVERLEDAFLGRGGTVILTVKGKVQEAAAAAFTGSRRGAAVVLDPRTGAVLALVSAPAAPATDAAAYGRLAADPGGPLRNRAVAEVQPPGPVFAIVVAAAALGQGLTPDTQIAAGPSYIAPQSTATIRNASGVPCPDTVTLAQAVARPCLTGLARYGVEQLGADKLRAAAGDFGFGTRPTLQGDDANAMGVAASEVGPLTGADGRVDRTAIGQSCLGQRDVRMTPLLGALIAAGIANDGRQRRPYVVQTKRDHGGRQVFQAEPADLRRSVPSDAAVKLAAVMAAGVTEGPARNAQVPGLAVAGLAATATTGQSGHGWFIGYATRNGAPVAAVAVLLEAAGPDGAADAARAGGQLLSAAAAG
jgi:hypothetical protein